LGHHQADTSSGVAGGLVMTCAVAAAMVRRGVWLCRASQRTKPIASNPTVPQTTVFAGFILTGIAHLVHGPLRAWPFWVIFFDSLTVPLVCKDFSPVRYFF